MSLADLAIKRPIFITCVVILSLAVGILSLEKLPVDLFPNVTFPVVMVSTTYRGAGPEEIETLVSRPLEEEYSSISGIKRLKSLNREGVSTVVAEFTLETDVKYAEQQIRDRTSGAKRKLPTEIDEPVIRRIDPADQPILIVSLNADLEPGQLFDLADITLRPKIEQIPQVGRVDILGGRKREIKVELDRKKLKEYEISATQVASRIQAAGQNIPAGKVDRTGSETVIRTVGEFNNLDSIRDTIVNFVGNDVPVTVARLGQVSDSLEDEKSRATVNGRPALLFTVYRQSGANTIKVADAVKDLVVRLNKDLLKGKPGNPEIQVVRDGAKPIRNNVEDVRESILIGILLTIVVVFFFLGSGRSTLITGMALPNSLIGAFILMSAAGFSINIMTLLALSLAVGLLIDDAIVVRENIFRHIEMGEASIPAAIKGTKEVTLAVVATTLTVIAVFGPIAFLQGVVGQFFKEFGLTICFAMAISLFDALTMAPMLSAYYAGALQHKAPTGFIGKAVQSVLDVFERFQKGLEELYVRVLTFSLRRPLVTLGGAVVVFILSLVAAKGVPKTFLPAQDNGEFTVDLDLPPGTNLDGMDETAKKVDEIIRKTPGVELSVRTVGDADGQSNKASFFVTLVASKDRLENTSQIKERVRTQLKPFAYANPKVKDYDAIGGGQRAFNLDLTGKDLDQLQKISNQLLAKLKANPNLKDPDVSFRPGKPEFQVKIDLARSEKMGVSTVVVGQELRTLVDGSTPAKYREHGDEYDVRVRLQKDQRDLEKSFDQTYVPNINGSLVKLANVANPVNATGPSNIDRMDRGRYVQISADIAPGGSGMGGAIDEVHRIFRDEIPLPPEVSYSFEGQAENFKELMANMLVAMGLGILFIYLVLASLYESFITPYAIMLVLPLAACGAFYALALTGQSLDLFSMIGCIMLMGLATKNSILLVDYTKQKVDEGMDRTQALMEAGRTRLRPILMTSFALIAGMLPIAIGLNEASKQRTSLGIAVIGGIVSSTLLTLVVVPAAYSYIDRAKIWLRVTIKRTFMPVNKAELKSKSGRKASKDEREMDVDLQPGV